MIGTSENDINLAIEEEDSNFSYDSSYPDKEKRDSEKKIVSLEDIVDQTKMENGKQMDRRHARKNRILYRKSFSKIGTKNFYAKTKTGELDGENLESQRKINEQMKSFIINNSPLLSDMNFLASNLFFGNQNKVSFDFSNFDNNNKGMVSNNGNNGGINRQATNSEKIVNALKGWMESSKLNSAYKGKTVVGNPNNGNEDILLEMDKIKSFDFYFSYNNIEYIIEKMEYLKKKNQRKIKKKATTRMKFNMEKNANSIEAFRRGSFMINKEDILSLEENIGKPQPKNTLMRKNFFKNVPHLEKLLQEELFDPNKIKEYYKNKYLKEKKKGILKFIKICIIDFFELICFCFYKRRTRTLKKLSYLNEKK